MNGTYSEYISDFAKELETIVSYDNCSSDEKRFIVNAFFNELKRNLYNLETAVSWKIKGIIESVRYIDGKLDSYNKNQSLDDNQIVALLALCNRQADNLKYLNSNRIEIPSIRYGDPIAYYSQVTNAYENEKMLLETRALDNRISETCRNLDVLDKSARDVVFGLLDQLSEKLEKCRAKGVKADGIKNYETELIKAKILKDKDEKEKAEYLAGVLEIDRMISVLIMDLNRSKTDPSSEVIPLLNKLDECIAECNSRGIPTSRIKNRDTEQIRRNLQAHVLDLQKAELLRQTSELDQKVSKACGSLDVFDSQSVEFVYVLLASLTSLINKCNENGVDISSIKNKNPDLVRTRIINQKKAREDSDYLNETIALDNNISLLINNLENSSEDPSKKALPMLKKLDKRVAECVSRGINTDVIRNKDTNKIRTKLSDHVQDLHNAEYLRQTCELDRLITELCTERVVSNNQNYASVLSYLELLSQKIEVCKKNGINIDQIKNRDTDSVKARIVSIREELKEKELTYNEMKELNHTISSLDKEGYTDESLWDELIDLCNRIGAMINECKNREWVLSDIRFVDYSALIEKYQLYQIMAKRDRIISTLVNETEKSKVRTLCALCNEQKEDINACNVHKWRLPDLLNKDPDITIKKNSMLRQKEHNKKRAKLLAGTILFVAIAVIVMTASIIIVYNHTHSKFPVSVKNVIGEDYRVVVQDLEASGFNNIVTIPIDYGLQAPYSVVDISVNESKTVHQGAHYSNNAPISIFYSSANRTDMSNVLNDWTDKTVDEICLSISNDEFNVSTIEVYSTSQDNNGLVSSIVINGEEWTDGPCYIPQGADIQLYYYGNVFEVGVSASDLIGENYKDVRRKLLDIGFDNVTCVRDDDLITGWINDDESVSSISINGISSFGERNTFFHNVEIIIHVHTFIGRDYSHIDG